MCIFYKVALGAGGAGGAAAEDGSTCAAAIAR
jgi:hypothetical protein